MWKNKQNFYRSNLKKEGKAAPEAWFIKRSFPKFVVDRYIAGEGEIHLTKVNKIIGAGVWRASYGNKRRKG